MKQTVWGDSPARFRQTLKKRIILCIGIGLFTLGLNILCALLRTDENHTLMLMLNILTDSLCGCFLVFYISIYIAPASKLSALQSRRKEVFRGTVVKIDPTLTRYMDLDCITVTVEGKKLFLPANTMVIAENTQYTFGVASNILVEAEL